MRGQVSQLKDMMYAIDDERKQQGELLDIMVRGWAALAAGLAASQCAAACCGVG